MPLSLLIIDDDRRLFELLDQYLGQNDCICQHAPNGEQGLKRILHGSFDAAIVDIMMPGMDGLEVLRRARQQSSLPILMLTAKGDETDRVVGLELGADDYLPKPFSPRELLARVRAVLRRGQSQELEPWLRAGDVELHRSLRQVRASGEEVTLTGLEFDLLAALMQRPGRVVSRTHLLQLAGRDDTFVGDRAVDVHISHLRKKLGDSGRDARLIRTVRGVGYVLGADT